MSNKNNYIVRLPIHKLGELLTAKQYQFAVAITPNDLFNKYYDKQLIHAVTGLSSSVEREIFEEYLLLSTFYEDDVSTDSGEEAIVHIVKAIERIILDHCHVCNVPITADNLTQVRFILTDTILIKPEF